MTVEDRIRLETEIWRGTPYVWGGTSQEGIDCSAFTQMIFRSQFEIQLPRTTAEQRRMGQKVRREDLQPGDLIFFRTTGFGFLFRKQHVGIYLSNSEFAHASGSEGVTISSLDDRYWRRALRAARRIVPVPDAP
jgi:cell wall-associated NlpC family hydrolase